ncbi:FHA domain-containing protein [Micropruina sp.]|uniref:FHA domain-containing protein FhaB/FipA n=1 Tax=Micropruina sp. TaxID=2737536 RepID=UPI00261C4CFA|nr:FHA domain-containing protein [Micropruina sp.]
MSDLVVLALKLLFLALLWLFVLFVGNVIRTDMFGRKLATDDAGELRSINELKKQKRKAARPAKKLPSRLRITRGKQEGMTVQLGEIVKIGRAADCQLILDDDYVSTRHAQIVRTDAGYVVEDLGSTNGTYVNNERVTSATPFGTADTLRIGRTLMVVEK